MNELEPFEKGHIDLYGPVNPASVGNNRYAMFYCDMNSSFGLIHLVRDKSLSEIKSSIKTWIVSINKMGFKMEIINGDSDTIFENEELVKYLNENKICPTWTTWQEWFSRENDTNCYSDVQGHVNRIRPSQEVLVILSYLCDVDL
jgi:hypothetical protein